ncbi:hypothetical protein GGI25_003951 [Coemansia spiralis]|uniref:Uncharacterized protein n=2 Tax=Coemansia TaxID=4863 RepID=A0A9W8KX37_9FUNG|nr:WD40-repeat-containing domain protein [Coemansia spiralis]KAJ1987720.1 hypothetical protein EDC05_005681 [Coemansia umbellata]KAJ2620963.1 hypothetical protein GGI26_004569 [Coemansia sp. RSA 1358]KAJ2675534.1 hypothetical protein GGI25_003951 [Coemansia spiralis]
MGKIERFGLFPRTRQLQELSDTSRKRTEPEPTCSLDGVDHNANSFPACASTDLKAALSTKADAQPASPGFTKATRSYDIQTNDAERGEKRQKRDGCSTIDAPEKHLSLKNTKQHTLSGINSDNGASTSDSDDNSILEALLAIGCSERSVNSELDRMFAYHEKQRQLYNKYTRRAERAAKEMQRTVKCLKRLSSTELPMNIAKSTCSKPLAVETSAVSTPERRQPPTTNLEQADRCKVLPEYIINSSSDNNDDYTDSDERMKSRTDVSSSIFKNTDGASTRNSRSGQMLSFNTNNTHPSTHDESLLLINNNSNNVGLEIDSVLLSSARPLQPFQFKTTLRRAFQLKPRAATICTFHDIRGQTAVAHGLDGSVQFWDPGSKERLLSISKETLGIDYVERIAQLTPSLLVALAGESKKCGSYGNKGSLVFLNKRPSSLESVGLQFAPPTRWKDPLHGGGISVVEGMPGNCRNSYDTALMLSGGEVDKSVYIWSLALANNGRVSGERQIQKLATPHTSGISALCYEHQKEYVISGSTGRGRLLINSARTAQLVANNDRMSCGGTIGSIFVCPTDPNLTMVSCITKDKQIQIFDLRLRMSAFTPVLALGKSEGSGSKEFRNSKFIRPSWHPDGRLIFCPLNRDCTHSSGGGDVYIWDSRYVRCREEEPQAYNPHEGSSIWSASFALPAWNKHSDKPVLVTVGSDHNIAFTDFSI